MAETLRGLVVALSLESSNFSHSMLSINQKIKKAKSERIPCPRTCFRFSLSSRIMIRSSSDPPGKTHSLRGSSPGIPQARSPASP